MTSAQCQQTAEDWFDKGYALDDHGKYDEAIEAYDEAIRLDPNVAPAWYNKGLALDELALYEEAISAYTEAVRRSQSCKSLEGQRPCSQQPGLIRRGHPFI